MQDFTKLKVWQKAHRLAIDVKRTIDRGKRWDYPRLRNQTLRAGIDCGHDCGRMREEVESRSGEVLRHVRFLGERVARATAPRS